MAERRVGNAVVFAGGELLSRLVAFVATAHLATALGPGPFGIVGFAFAAVSYLTVVVDIGFTDVGSREVARAEDEADAAALGAAVNIVRFGLATIGLAALIAVAPLLQADAVGRRVLIITGILLLVVALDAAWVYRGLGRGVRVGVSLVARRLLYAGLVFALVRGPDDVVMAPLAQVVGEAVGVVWLGGALLVGGLPHVDLRRGWRTFRQARTLILTKLLRTSVVTLDVVLLGLLATNRDVGLYSAPYRLCFLFMAVGGAIQVAYLPDLARGGGEARRDAAQRHQEVSAVIGIPMAVGGILVAGPVLRLIFGAEYAEAARAFQILLASIGVLFVFSPVHNVLLAENRLHVETRAMGLAAALNAMLNFLWIPRFGIVGAAWATLIAEVVILAGSALPLGRTMASAVFRPIWPPFVASAAMGAAVALVGADRPLTFTIPLGVVAYMLALTTLRGVPQDARLVLQRIRRRRARS